MTAKRNERGKRPQIQATVDAALFERIKAEAAAAFDSVSAIVEARLNASYATAGGLPKTRFADTKEKSADADLQLKNIRLQQLRRELLPVELAFAEVEKAFAVIRSEFIGFIHDVARENNLDAAALERRGLLRMGGTFQADREPFDRLGDEFSREPLP